MLVFWTSHEDVSLLDIKQRHYFLGNVTLTLTKKDTAARQVSLESRVSNVMLVLKNRMLMKTSHFI